MLMCNHITNWRTNGGVLGRPRDSGNEPQQKRLCKAHSGLPMALIDWPTTSARVKLWRIASSASSRASGVKYLQSTGQGPVTLQRNPQRWQGDPGPCASGVTRAARLAETPCESLFRSFRPSRWENPPGSSNNKALHIRNRSTCFKIQRQKQERQVEQWSK